jgi:hypothetical protein
MAPQVDVGLHERMTKLEGAVDHLSEKIDLSQAAILSRLDERHAQWLRQCDLRHADIASKKTTRSTRVGWLLTLVALALTTLGLTLNHCAIKSAKASIPSSSRAP